MTCEEMADRFRLRFYTQRFMKKKLLSGKW